MPLLPRLAAAIACGILLSSGLAVPADATGRTAPPTPPARAAVSPHKTTKTEATRVDRVKVKPTWKKCHDYAQCATVKLPRDYDHPSGATVTVALLRVKARDQKRRIGSLFVNPGGPGASATKIALAAPYFLGDEVLDRFDIVGFDPRGVPVSTNVRCFKDTKAQATAMRGLGVVFPWTKAEEDAWLASSKAIAKACSTTGKTLAGAMSTAQVARDMDVLRRALGDKKLTYLGFSYGTVLGNYYANMFPDRVRAIAIDGVVNPSNWIGSTTTQNQIQDDRLRSADGAYQALKEILARCAAAGARVCPFATGGDPLAKLAELAKRLRAKPLVYVDDAGKKATLTYAGMVKEMLNALYEPSGYTYLVDRLHTWHTASTPGTAARQRSTLPQLGAATRFAPLRRATYNNSYEAFLAVACTDGLHPTDASWRSLAAKSDQRAPYFGRAWAWGTTPCGRTSWKVKDEDAYRGPFNKRTAAPVLVVGSHYDPATNYTEAVSTAKLLPNSRLLASKSWGHTAYGTSACVTGAVDSYLLRGTMPAAGKVCVGDVQPFAAEVGAARVPRSAARQVMPPYTKEQLAKLGPPAPGEPKDLPPVTAAIAGVSAR